MGIITETQQAIVVMSTGERKEYEGIQNGFMSQSQVFLQGCDGKIYQPPHVIQLPQVISMQASSEHVLCHTSQGIFGIGSNRFSQLAGIESCQTPVLIEHFEGLAMNSVTIACGPFHSAVAIEGDLYTFGLFKEGRLGWGEGSGDRVDLAVFLDKDGQEVDVNVVKVACGSCHTLVLDDQGKIWSCGSNKYGQLGRTLKGKEYDLYFGQCTDINEKATDCFAGRWNSFILA
ncbi:unnamed protein product [Rhizopus stolonifer]